MKIKIKKILVFAIVLSEIFLIGISPVLAIRIPSPQSVAAALESRYHLNLESMQNMGENFNVSDNKKIAPQVFLSFDPSDPKDGEKLTVKANPMYFQNPHEALYFTWYLKRKRCDLGKINNNDSQERKNCDKDEDREVTVEDWKIEAMRILANNEFDYNKALGEDSPLCREEEKPPYCNDKNKYSDNKDPDNDGYPDRRMYSNPSVETAFFGGDDRYKMPSRCYIHNFESGVNYEIVDNVGNQGVVCPEGRIPACLINEEVNTSPISYRCINTFESPTCNSSQTVYCSTSDVQPYCILNSYANQATLGNYACTDPLLLFYPPNYPEVPAIPIVDTNQNNLLCQFQGSTNPPSACKHLFPHAPGYRTGDGRFRAEEEKFWRTDPEDPDTADNGNMDEANVVGLGRTDFSWHYQSGDKVGVFVEGTSMINTKYEDSSMMIMWAYPKNKCPITNTGVKYEHIKGYNVKIPIASVDLNDCIDDNLVDPREGGQATNLDISLSYSPQNPRNDPTESDMGDTVVVQSSIANAAQKQNSIYYEWKIEKSLKGDPNDEDWLDITDKFKEISPQKGNNLSSLSFRLNLPKSGNNAVLKENVEYLRVKVKASENFDDGATRDGKSSVIIKVLNSTAKIAAFGVETNEENGKTRVESDRNEICKIDDDNPDKRNEIICPVVKNDIITLVAHLDDHDYENFSWTINSRPLICDENVSNRCSFEGKEQIPINFFPAIGEVGAIFTIGFSANNVRNGKTIELTRTFQIVEPFIKIMPKPKENNQTTTTFRKHLGVYEDLNSNCKNPVNGVCYYDDFSENVFEAIVDEDVELKINFHPASIKDQTQIQWLVNGEDKTPLDIKDELLFKTDIEDIGSVYHVVANGIYKKERDIRKALYDIWKISQFDSGEEYLSDAVQVEVTLEQGYSDLTSKAKSKQFFASIIANAPENLIFLLRLFLTVFLMIFVSGLLLSFNYKNISNKL